MYCVDYIILSLCIYACVHTHCVLCVCIHVVCECSCVRAHVCVFIPFVCVCVYMLCVHVHVCVHMCVCFVHLFVCVCHTFTSGLILTPVSCLQTEPDLRPHTYMARITLVRGKALVRVSKDSHCPIQGIRQTGTLNHCGRDRT